MSHDFYRPSGMRRMRGGLDENGNVVAWSDYLADTSIDAQWSDPGKFKPNGAELPGSLVYPIAYIRTDYSPVQSAVPRGWWRSVGHSFNGLAVECFMDELAHAANQDPYLFRRHMLLQPAVETSTPDPGTHA